MKALLTFAVIATCGLAAISAGANAAEMPSALHGHWCQDIMAMQKAGDFTTLRFHRKRGAHCPPEDSNDDNSIRIKGGSTFVWGGTNTKVLSVVPHRYEWSITVKRDGGEVEEYTFLIKNKQLVVFE